MRKDTLSNCATAVGPMIARKMSALRPAALGATAGTTTIAEIAARTMIPAPTKKKRQPCGFFFVE